VPSWPKLAVGDMTSILVSNFCTPYLGIGRFFVIQKTLTSEINKKNPVCQGFKKIKIVVFGCCQVNDKP